MNSFLNYDIKKSARLTKKEDEAAINLIQEADHIRSLVIIT